MIMRLTAASAIGLGLLAACNEQTAPPPQPTEQTRVAEPANPTPDPFLGAVNFECEGGGKADAVFDIGSPPSALVRIDGGMPTRLLIDETATSGMIYKDADVSINFEGDDLQLTSGGGTKTCKFVARSLPAPAAEGVIRDLTEADAGAMVELKVGEKISISLSGVPTAGYLWGAENPPAFVKVTDGPGGATTTAQFLPGFAGGNHWEVLVVEGVAPGQGDLDLVQKRPWEEKAAPDDKRLKFRLTVK
jgi:predicted secreted protein